MLAYETEKGGKSSFNFSEFNNINTIYFMSLN